MDIKFNNQSGLEFIHIASEEWREYKTPVGTYRINEPLYLNVSENGHRIFDAKGISHYIDTRKGFFLSWMAKDGSAHFVK